MTGLKLVEKKKEVIESRKSLLNVELALETIQSCLLVLDLANKVQTRIANGKYYSALKLLDELQDTHLRKMTHLSFVKTLIGSIPVTQEVIRTSVLREMRDWLLKVKDQTYKVGKYALSLTIKKFERNDDLLSQEDINEQGNISNENIDIDHEDGTYFL